MSKISNIKFNRLFERNKSGLVVKRDKTIDPIPAQVRKCLGCGKPLLMFYKQIVFWHKECRTEGRRVMHNQLKRQLR